ncbi:MAG: cytochrome c [Saprospiraceae bacterium]
MKTKIVAVAITVGAAIGLVGMEGCGEVPRSQGKALYEYYCANCHQPDGGGLVGNIPPLAQADWLQTNRNEIACIIRYGMKGPMQVNGLEYNGVMAGAHRITDAEITNITNYVLSAWSNDLPPIGATQISEQLKGCTDREIIQLANPQTLGQ